MFDPAKLELALRKVDHAELRYMQPELKMAVNVADQEWLQQFCALLKELKGESEWVVKAISPFPTVALYEGDQRVLLVYWATKNDVVFEGDGWFAHLKVKDGFFDRCMNLCTAKQEANVTVVVESPAKIDLSNEVGKLQNQSLVPATTAVAPRDAALSSQP